MMGGHEEDTLQFKKSSCEVGDFVSCSAGRWSKSRFRT